MSNGAAVRVAYVVNRYPFVSHTFIRREIQALERLGMEVVRISVRGGGDELVGDDDRREAARTKYVLGSGWVRLLASLVATAVARHSCSACISPRLVSRPAG
jgi:hypothetical protein